MLSKGGCPLDKAKRDLRNNLSEIDLQMNKDAKKVLMLSFVTKNRKKEKGYFYRQENMQKELTKSIKKTIQCLIEHWVPGWRNW